MASEIIDRVESEHERGPRGDYYEWCNLHADGTLEFGDEQGNYCGGTYFSADFCLSGNYWESVKTYLRRFCKNNYRYYGKIAAMIERHHISLPFDFAEVWRGLWPERAVKRGEVCPICNEQDKNIYFKDGFWKCKKCCDVTE